MLRALLFFTVFRAPPPGGAVSFFYSGSLSDVVNASLNIKTPPEAKGVFLK